jgi:hypothetical protein
MNLKISGLLAASILSMPLNAQESEADSKIYMQAAMARSTLSHCLVVGKAEGKLAQKAYADWLAPRKEAVERIASQGCGQVCQMLGDPLQPLKKPANVSMPASFASLNMTPEESKHLCEEGIKAVSESVPEPSGA